MRLLCLVDFNIKDGDRWLWSFLPGNTDEVDFITTHVQDRFASWGKLLNYYPAFLLTAIKAQRMCRTKRYDAVVAWEGKNGFPFSIVKNITGEKTPLVVLAFSVRGILDKYTALQKFGAKKIDYMTVPTRFEKEHYGKTLNYPAEKIAFSELGVYDLFKDSPGCSGDYIYSGGRSGRDYKTFFEAVSDTSIPVIVNARPFNYRGLKVPPNVQCSDMLPLQEMKKLVRSSRFVVLPLQNVSEAVGLSVILYTMAAGKAVVATRLPGASDYVIQGETGLLVEPQNPAAMSEAIRYLWAHPELSEAMGKRAREVFEERYTFKKFAQRTHQQISDFLNKNG